MSIIDFHNHLIPGVDDGAQDLEEAEAGVAAFVADGVGGFVATPHVDASLTVKPEQIAERLAEIDEGWSLLDAMCAEQFPRVQVFRAVELLLDVPEPDLSDPRIRINGGPFFLMEFPFMMVPPQSVRVISMLAQSGYTPIIAHPERYQGVVDPAIAEEWKGAGALLQVNGGSLLGKYGSQAKKLAFHLLERGWADYLCSDFHARGAPLVAQYEGLLIELGGEEQANTLMRTNPARMLSGQRPLPVPALRLRKPNLWARVGALFAK